MFVCIYNIQIFDRQTQHLFIKIHTQLHIPAMLGQTSARVKPYKNIV